MDTLFKDNEELHGVFMEPMMVMLGSHSFRPCLDSNNHLEGHDNVFTSKFVEEDHHGTLQGKKAYNELIPDIDLSLYSDTMEDQKSYPYSQYIPLKCTSWSNLKEIQRNNDLRNENIFRQAITHYEQEPLRHVNRKGVVVLPLHNQGPTSGYIQMKKMSRIRTI